MVWDLDEQAEQQQEQQAEQRQEQQADAAGSLLMQQAMQLMADATSVARQQMNANMELAYSLASAPWRTAYMH